MNSALWAFIRTQPMQRPVNVALILINQPAAQVLPHWTNARVIVSFVLCKIFYIDSLDLRKDHTFIFCILIAVTVLCNVDCNGNGNCNIVDNIGLCICYTGKLK